MKFGILELIKKELLANKNELKRLCDIDKKYNPNTFDIDRFIRLVDLYNDDYNLNNNVNKNIGIIYFGNVEFTLCMSIFSIVNDIKLSLFIQDYLVGINTGIISIINKVLKDHKINNEIKIYNMYSWKVISSLDFDKLICFGDSNSYNILKKMNTNNLLNYKYGIDILKDGEEFNEILSKVSSLAYNTCIETKCFNEVEDLIKYGNNYYTLIFSRDKNKILKIKNKIISKYIFVNENPFPKIKIDYGIIKDVINT